MKRIVLLMASLALLAGCDEPPPAATLTATPAQYVGTWEASAEDCKAGGGPSHVVVAADRLVFPDSQLAVTGALPDGERAVRVDGELTTSMGGGPSSIRLELSDDGRTLTVVNGSNLVPRVKCPA